jgi:hypothetical protein
MSKRLTSAVLPLALAVAALPARAVDKAPSDRAIDQALNFLQRQQDADGAWRGGPGNPKNPAITGLCVMAFLAAGHVPGEGRYGTTVEKGVEWILKEQKPNGLIAGQGGHEMYQHGIATLMLAEAAGMTGARQGEELRQKLEKAVALILKAQRTTPGSHHGGWRYHLDPRQDYPPSDISVTGWQVMALRAAKNLGCDIPAERIDWAVAYVQRCYDPASGGFRYYPGSHVTIGCTGTSILALELCGKERHRSTEALKAGAYLINRPPYWGQEHFFYSVYYCSQATFQLGGNYWSFYKPQLHKILLNNQQADGSWWGRDGSSRIYGRNYCSAMAVLALAVEYRFLPIYQRAEEPAEEVARDRGGR